MMIVALASASAFLLIAPAGLARPGRRVHPGDWTRWSFASIVSGAVAAELALLLFAAPTVLRAFGFHSLVDACATMTGSLMPGGPVIGWTVASISLLLPVGFFIGANKAGRANRQVAKCFESVPSVEVDGVRLVVTEHAAAVALTVRGSDPTIIVSTAMRDALSDEQFEAVVQHEAAHLAHRHDLYLAVLCGLDLAFWFVPFIHRSSGAIRCGLERWADHEAAEHAPGGRSTVRDALLAVVFGPSHSALAAFGAVDTIAARVHALQGPTASTIHRRVMVAFLFAVMLAATAAAAAGGASLWQVLIMPVFCELAP